MTGLKVGDLAPQFEAQDATGTTFSTNSLAGKKWVIYFYPKDNTPGCTQQACSLRDHYAQFLSQGVTVLGVSMDSAKSHVKFAEKHELPFPLLVDEEKKVIEAFQVWGPKKFMGREYDGIHRTTFIVDEKGVISGIIETPKTKVHAEEVLAHL